ncbi:uncharacterized protein SPPG_04890 [Spizellomyces punctatus DAOM BR117]|uniref:RING-type domain-containing protein n=1 Tax=Spizellomyces punctatus (strain DAOM BR117) TaxID=645134 RepID=A0A0L0HDD4_SPIPD|nr:uncharacterized protein SPPG_04890 [Spizellomyces punctatus DAOM BR117]KNC99495.1 hypothetical protein SPPG_04890 [Spizellomyces punctatus DAOM BR117]|eukprot:XP_016607535.1 hypothetical protein SPPG_04890 [Spizellomyces punctatus DAOM BR117]
MTLHSLCELFPQYPKEELAVLLQQENGNVDAVVETMLLKHNVGPVERASNGTIVDLSTDDLEITTSNAQASDSTAPTTGPPTPSRQPQDVLCEMFPDAHTDYLEDILRAHMGDIAAASEAVCAADGKYPKRADFFARGQKRGAEDDEGSKRKKRDYTVVLEEPMTRSYINSCYQQLQIDYPEIPANNIKTELSNFNHQYTPTFNRLKEMRSNPTPPFKRLTRGRHPGKAPVHPPDETFLKEWEALLKQIAEEDNKENTPVECGCCYCDYNMDDMTQCDEGHLFCKECARKAAENSIGLRKIELKCLHNGGCESLFPPAAIEQFLPEKMWKGYLKLCQEVDLERAGIPDFHSCPFCPFGAIVSTNVEEDKLFYCRNEECMAVSCRKCNRRNHAPLTCEESKSEDVLDVKHQIEEAMTEALLRECHSCKKKFYKEEGCNKMTCTCGAVMCYVCRQPVRDYTHFRDGVVPGTPGAKCPLFENTITRNAEDVQRAGQEAILTAKLQNPEIDESKIKIDLPTVPPAGAANQGVNHIGQIAEQFQQLQDHLQRVDDLLNRAGNNVRRQPFVFQRYQGQPRPPRPPAPPPAPGHVPRRGRFAHPIGNGSREIPSEPPPPQTHAGPAQPRQPHRAPRPAVGPAPNARPYPPRFGGNHGQAPRPTAPNGNHRAHPYRPFRRQDQHALRPQTVHQPLPAFATHRPHPAQGQAPALVNDQQQHTVNPSEPVFTAPNLRTGGQASTGPRRSNRNASTRNLPPPPIAAPVARPHVSRPHAATDDDNDILGDDDIPENVIELLDGNVLNEARRPVRGSAGGRQDAPGRNPRRATAGSVIEID